MGDRLARVARVRRSRSSFGRGGCARADGSVPGRTPLRARARRSRSACAPSRPAPCTPGEAPTWRARPRAPARPRQASRASSPPRARIGRRLLAGARAGRSRRRCSDCAQRAPRAARRRSRRREARSRPRAAPPPRAHSGECGTAGRRPSRRATLLDAASTARRHGYTRRATGVAQPGSAPPLGGGGSRFKSGHPDRHDRDPRRRAPGRARQAHPSGGPDGVPRAQRLDRQPAAGALDRIAHPG